MKISKSQLDVIRRIENGQYVPFDDDVRALVAAGIIIQDGFGFRIMPDALTHRESEIYEFMVTNDKHHGSLTLIAKGVGIHSGNLHRILGAMIKKGYVAKFGQRYFAIV